MGYKSDNIAFNNAMDSLSHYGVKGMEWGKRNEETLRKYGLLEGTKTSVGGPSKMTEKNDDGFDPISNVKRINDYIDRMSGVNVIEVIGNFGKGIADYAVDEFNKYRNENIEYSKKYYGRK